MKNDETLKAVGMAWYVYFCYLGPAVFCLSILTGIISAFVGVGKFYLFGLFGIFFVVSLSILKDIIFYQLIKCPQCKGRMNMDENGNKVPEALAMHELRSGQGCRHCGWKPT